MHIPFSSFPFPSHVHFSCFAWLDIGCLEARRGSGSRHTSWTSGLSCSSACGTFVLRVSLNWLRARDRHEASRDTEPPAPFLYSGVGLLSDQLAEPLRILRPARTIQSRDQGVGRGGGVRSQARASRGPEGRDRRRLPRPSDDALTAGAADAVGPEKSNRSLVLMISGIPPRKLLRRQRARAHDNPPAFESSCAFPEMAEGPPLFGASSVQTLWVFGDVGVSPDAPNYP